MPWRINKGILNEFPVVLAAPAVATYTLLLSTVQPKIINSISVQMESGTATFTLKINSTAITGLSAITATTTKTAYSATANNTMAVNDDLKIEFTSISSPVQFSLNIAFS